MSNVDSSSLIAGLFAMLLALVPVPLTIVFAVLKFAGEITWSWLWVLCPFWGAIGLLVVLVVVAIILCIIGKWQEE